MSEIEDISHLGDVPQRAFALSGCHSDQLGAAVVDCCKHE